MIAKTCELCGISFEGRLETTKFCSRSCVGKQKSTQSWYKEKFKAPKLFAEGSIPWNKGMKGIHLSPHSEFKPGRRPERDKWKIGDECIRNERRGGARYWVKVADPSVWKKRAVKVWEDANGPVPKGMLIHHQDRDQLNDKLDNLRCLTRAEHIAEHLDDLLRGKGLL